MNDIEKARMHVNIGAYAMIAGGWLQILAEFPYSIIGLVIIVPSAVFVFTAVRKLKEHTQTPTKSQKRNNFHMLGIGVIAGSIIQPLYFPVEGLSKGLNMVISTLVAIALLTFFYWTICVRKTGNEEDSY